MENGIRLGHHVFIRILTESRSPIPTDFAYSINPSVGVMTSLSRSVDNDYSWPFRKSSEILIFFSNYAKELTQELQSEKLLRWEDPSQPQGSSAKKRSTFHTVLPVTEKHTKPTLIPKPLGSADLVRKETATVPLWKRLRLRDGDLRPALPHDRIPPSTASDPLRGWNYPLHIPGSTSVCAVCTPVLGYSNFG